MQFKGCIIDRYTVNKKIKNLCVPNTQIVYAIVCCACLTLVFETIMCFTHSDVYFKYTCILKKTKYENVACAYNI